MWIKQNKKHIFYVSLLLAIVLIDFFAFLNPNTLYWSEVTATYYPRAVALKESITSYHDFFPLWQPYYFSGTPWFSKADTLGSDYILMPLIMVVPNTFFAVKLNYLLDMFLSGLAMYIFMIYLFKNEKAAFVASLIYTFNIWAILTFKWGHLSTINGYPFLPLVVMFVMKTLKEKKWVLNSVITALLMALSYRAGPDMKIFLWQTLIIFVYAAYHILTNFSKQQAVKTVLAFLIIFVLFFGLSAQRLLLTKEDLDLSPRAHLSYEESSGRKITLSQMFPRLIEPVYKGIPMVRRVHYEGGHLYYVGIFAFLLALIAIIKKPLNKKILYFTIVAIISLFLVSGSFAFYLLWKYVPPFDSFRYMPRLLPIFTLSMAALAGAGYIIFEKYLKKKFKLSGFSEKLVVVSVSLLIIIDLCVFGLSPYYGHKMQDVYKTNEDNHVLQYISKQPGIFRIQTYETTGIDWGIEFWTIPLKLENIYGYDSTWNSDYFNVYLGIASREPAKFWGILNVKYVTSMQELNISEFKFVEKFPECEVCYPDVPNLDKADGPYLYENMEFVPRAYFAQKSILVVGKKDGVVQTAYYLMLDKNFNPKTTIAVVGKESVDDYSAEELKRFDAVFLTEGSVTQNSMTKLKSYVDNGGVLSPDIVNGKEAITEEEISNLLKQYSAVPAKGISDEDIKTINFNKKEISVKKQTGFLTLSETYSIHPHWKIYADGKEKEILRVNGVVSAVYLEELAEKITFVYAPRSYVIGKWITILAIVLVLTYFIYIKFRGKKQIRL